jgi:putative phosphoesterase
MSVVGVISDTHGLMDPEALRLLGGVERILHAGDVGRMAVLHALEALAPVHAVRGNVDNELMELPPALMVTLFQVPVMILHDLGDVAVQHADVREAIRRERPQVVVFGHTHQPLVAERDGVLYFTPGSAGPRRFRLPRSVGYLHLDDGHARAEVKIFG